MMEANRTECWKKIMRVRGMPTGGGDQMASSQPQHSCFQLLTRKTKSSKLRMRWLMKIESGQKDATF